MGVAVHHFQCERNAQCAINRAGLQKAGQKTTAEGLEREQQASIAGANGKMEACCGAWDNTINYVNTTKFIKFVVMSFWENILEDSLSQIISSLVVLAIVFHLKKLFLVLPQRTKSFLKKLSLFRYLKQVDLLKKI